MVIGCAPGREPPDAGMRRLFFMGDAPVRSVGTGRQCGKIFGFQNGMISGKMY